jgi:CHAT domain-containing protein
VPVAEITARAAALAALLPPVDAERMHEGLQVISGRAWSDIAWPVLYAWHDDQAVNPPITVLRLAGTARAARGAPHAVAVHVAAQLGGSTLPALDAASSEASLIRGTMPTLAVTMRAPTTRAALLDAFAATGSWVHVAAHGKAAGGQLGGGGIWLDPVRAVDPPELLSAFDVLERRSAASLVVLNACDLGREGHRRAQAGSFADALLTTGTSQVVAALWPVSDGAARIWVSAFYRHINETPAAVDVATAAARTALRASRAYRHPHYWAGLVHFAAANLRDAAAGGG